MRALILVAGAALALAACSSNNGADNNTMAVDNLTAENLVVENTTTTDMNATNMATDNTMATANATDNTAANATTNNAM